MNIKAVIYISNSARMPKVLTKEENEQFLDILDKLVANDVFIGLTYRKLPQKPSSLPPHPENLAH